MTMKMKMMMMMMMILLMLLHDGSSSISSSRELHEHHSSFGDTTMVNMTMDVMAGSDDAIMSIMPMYFTDWNAYKGPLLFQVCV